MPNPTDRAEAAHLLRRAGFGGNAAEIERVVAEGYEAAVERLLVPGAVDDGDTERLVARAADGLDDARLVDGQALWLVRMLYTARPLQEKMALFWHNHFATSAEKVHPPALLYRQIAGFRAGGLGRFDDLLAGVARDPAMIFWLDNNTNRRGNPNENWARELMELFTIGIGHYTEQDVKEAARAFTGWSATRDGQFLYRRGQHDAGRKTVLGHSGTLDGDDVLTIVLNRRETGQLLGRKLWRWFVNDTPDAAGVERLADVYMDSGHDITAMLRTLFLSAAFRSPANYYATVKNPPELLVGLLKQTGADARLRDTLAPVGLRALARAARTMDMALYAPPNVGGWPGGRTWVTAGSYLARANFAEQLLLGQAVDVAALARTLGAGRRDALVDAALDWALPGAAAPALRAALDTYLDQAAAGVRVPGLLRLLFSSPTYQLN